MAVTSARVSHKSSALKWEAWQLTLGREGWPAALSPEMAWRLHGRLWKAMEGLRLDAKDARPALARWRLLRLMLLGMRGAEEAEHCCWRCCARRYVRRRDGERLAQVPTKLVHAPMSCTRRLPN